jgi:hypothetical protein
VLHSFFRRIYGTFQTSRFGGAAERTFLLDPSFVESLDEHRPKRTVTRAQFDREVTSDEVAGDGEEALRSP